ncbi:pyrroline-5-carboxylate reductase [Fructobacillus cardui]|uniref:Pyrroline-5-carboxylate reductase n=1 Tax=Fructobacillus cardui TaxID=2893170 RepID=A0ABN9YUH6_9LACO|nr:pyrroline-5-carboxylate reductase dimerization domain-containing protein [uncultured Fructobacillus sp.]CAK1224271.1 Pyrroline-5-carboxylate reductase (ProC) [Fructobacillus cardui]CAK1246791.1 Pyrroline-5-carboxylate reductase (ProC) [Fructobacillus cardui]CAK1251868.1 Pyrroline-5-carboxylate reductase (ProC) [Fructobacillus cardui]
MKIAVVGLGHMGTALVQGLKLGGHTVLGYSSNAKKAEALQIPAVTTYEDLVQTDFDVMMLTVPAKLVTTVLAKIVAAGLSEKVIVLSAAASVENADLRAAAPKNPVTTFIPNIPVAVQAGTIALAVDESVAGQNDQVVHDVLESLGDVLVVKEDQLAIAGTIGGCSPAFIDVLMDAMEDAAVAKGMDRKQAGQMVASVVAGTAQLAQQSDLSAGDLKGQITSPGGTTIKGVLTLDQHGFRGAVHAAILAAAGD